jgi:glycine cleavage system aminomethyltransferase T
MALGDEHVTLRGAGTTDVADGFATFAVVGPGCMDVLGKLSPVDMDSPGKTYPCAAQAPVEDIPCLIVRLNGNGNIPGLIISVARGYGQSFLDMFLDAGNEYGITVAGWERFQGWLAM